MKNQTKHNLILTLLFIIGTFSINAQDYCDYTEQIAIDFNSAHDTPFVILEQDDGKILTLGTTYDINVNAFYAAVVRMDADLQGVDTTFANNGRFLHTWDQRNYCISGALQSDGKILLGGVQASSNAGSQIRPYVARLLPDGTPDSTWGVAGSVKFGTVTMINGKGNVVGIKELDNGSVQALVLGDGPNGVGVFQFTDIGTLDDDFSDNGVAFFDIPQLYMQSEYGKGLFMDDGSFVLVGKAFDGSITKPCITKITPEGELDLLFGTNGTLYIEQSIRYNFVGIYAELTDEGDIIIAATKEQSSGPEYLAFKVNGQTGVLDNSFGTNGMAETNNSFDFNGVHALAIDPSNGDVVVLGTSSNSGHNNTIWRISSDGEDVSSCGGDAFQISPINYQSGYKAAIFGVNGNIIIAGAGGTMDQTTGEGNNFIFPRPVYDVCNDDDILPTIVCPDDLETSLPSWDFLVDVIIEAPTVDDNCGILEFYNSINASENASGLFEQGTTEIIWTVTDLTGNQNTCNQMITVNPNTEPYADCGFFTVILDDNGQGTMFPEDIDNGSYTPFGELTLSVSQDTFDCDDATSWTGSVDVILTVLNEQGQTATCETFVIIVDNTLPTIVCPDDVEVTLAQGSLGMDLTLEVPTVDDNCGVSAFYNVINDTEDASDYYESGYFEIIWTATDLSGNLNSCSQFLDVYDNEEPYAFCNDNVVEVDLDENGIGTLSTEEVDNGSYVPFNDTWDISLSQDTFTCDDVTNPVTVTLTIENDQGQLATCETLVIIVDNIPPTIVGQNITVDLAGQPDFVITMQFIDNGTYDNCDLADMYLTSDTDTIPSPLYTFYEVGEYTVYLGATDNSGTIATPVPFIVTVIDSTVGIEDISSEENFISIYPNPTNNVITISSNNNQEINEIWITDMSGKLILRKNNLKNNTVDLSGLAQGVYLCQLKTETNTYFEKIVKR